LCIGPGGLGSAGLYYLASACIWTIGIADCDKVELTNLQRQILHRTSDLDRYKTDSAKAKLEQLNPEIKIKTITTRVDACNIMGIIAAYDFVIDATDNFASKYMINDACVKAGKPFSHAGVLAMRGQALTYMPGYACLRCFLPEAPANPETAQEYGILGAVAGHIGTLQAIEAISFILAGKAGLQGKLLTYEALPYRYRLLELKKNPGCPVCGKKETI
jgi:adenylyltransferase/sulfurtransferase